MGDLVEKLTEALRGDTGAVHACLGITALACVVRTIVVVWFTFLDWKTSDTLSYFEQARVLLEGGFYEYFPNGFPALIALVWSIPGLEGTRWPLHLLTVLCSTAIVAFVFSLAGKASRSLLVAVTAALCASNSQ